jgi:hypothetical protein
MENNNIVFIYICGLLKDVDSSSHHIASNYRVTGE